MAGRESGEPRIGRQIGEFHRYRVVDQCTEQPSVSVGAAADLVRHLVRHPVCDEVGEPRTFLVDDADGGVAGVGEFGRRLADPVESGVQFEARADGSHGFQQLRYSGGEFAGQALQAAGRPGRGFESVLRILL